MPAEAAPEPTSLPKRLSGEESARRFPDLYQAAVNGPATFRHLVQAQKLARAKNDQIASDAGHWLITHLAQKFSEVHGGIEKEYYCQHVTGGCLLAKDRTVYSILNSPPPELVDAEVSLKVLAKEAGYGLRDANVAQQLEEATDHAYSGLTRVMVAADLVGARASSELEIAEAIAAAQNEYALIESRIEKLLQRQAGVDYFRGVLLGVIPTLVLVALFGLAASAWWKSALVPSALVAAIAMSALGATISVIQRMSSDSLVMNYRVASSAQRKLLGAFRPGIGAIFGSLAYFTLLAGVLAGGATPGTTPASVAVFAVAGFAAGFSERFAADLLEQAQKLVATAKS
ncbi:hypothetical protein EV643_12656 [Kribbella sp. VKM Ac-2527]|uniref:Uncharacterized protein n=1 Tax=Kribbella caucasensis TaxID=2512215 RepID=A0A4R6JGR3_9ACTN|nr:hypothetical protein [Kribbella sp. VKM Ac-2527]TDO34697.1 hypothetical protein EV643_12656 [Kribbella sp. VKM Ac-2527]